MIADPVSTLEEIAYEANKGGHVTNSQICWLVQQLRDARTALEQERVTGELRLNDLEAALHREREAHAQIAQLKEVDDFRAKQLVGLEDELSALHEENEILRENAQDLARERNELREQLAQAEAAIKYWKNELSEHDPDHAGLR